MWDSDTPRVKRCERCIQVGQLGHFEPKIEMIEGF